MDILVRDGKAYGFGTFVLDPVRRTLNQGSTPVTLSATVFDTLLYLVEHPGRVVSKDELLDSVWPRKVVEEANVSQTIYTLRKALTAAGAAEQIIATAPGQGYRFVLPVRPLDIKDSAPASPPAGTPASRREGPERGKGRFRPWPKSRTGRAAAMGVGAIVLVAMAVGVWRWREAHGVSSPGVVVLAAFQNLTKDPVFDRSLAKALEVDLDQSPSITALSDRQVGDTLDLMNRPKDTFLTPAVAAEVCARNNGQAVIEGGIAALGAKYLLTLDATDCSSGRPLAAEKIEVSGREAVVPALDRLIGQMREKLGESRDQIAKFSVPIANEKTSSLAAIKAYSEAAWLANSGQSDQAAALYHQAIELDPNFAAAYNALAALEFNTDQKDAAREAMAKAYALRDTVNEELRLNIQILYNSLVSNDYNAVVHSAQAMTAIYPRQGSAWINLSNAENWLGQYSPAIEAGRHAIEAAPRREASYVVLARALMHAGRLNEAAALLAQAAGKGLEGGQSVALMMEIDIARNDAAGMKRELGKAGGKPFEADVLALAARDAYRQGEVRRGDALYAQVGALLSQEGDSDGFVGVRASDLSAMGLEDRARGLLANAPPDSDPMNNILTLATTGESARAQADLKHDLHERPSDTLMNAVLAPLVRATVALQQGHADQAVAALEPARPYEARDNDTPYLRGQAYLAAKDGAHAAGEFQKILDHPGIEPADVLRPLARLGMARALALEKNRTASQAAYQQFFAEWKNADADLAALREARVEYARL
jgi:DNA-binding winged helix-turn-helix (wHTH) protein/tetratricopeptide (TPR) repeat protein